MRYESRQKATATRKRNSEQKLAELPTTQELRKMRSLLSVQQVAIIMCICPTTVRRYSASGKLPPVRIGNRLRFYPAVVADFLEGRFSDI
jgi:hypothetical protein